MTGNISINASNVQTYKLAVLVILDISHAYLLLFLLYVEFLWHFGGQCEVKRSYTSKKAV